MSSFQNKAFSILFSLGLVIGLSFLARLLLGSAFSLLLFTLILCFITHPLFRWLESKKVPRMISMIVGFILFFGGLSILGIWLIPILFSQLKDFVAAAPELMDRLLNFTQALALRLGLEINFPFDDPLLYLRQHSQEVLNSFGKPTFVILSRFFSNSASLLLWILQLFLVPVFYVYLSSDWERMVARGRALIPPRFLASFDTQINVLKDVFAAYFRGQALVCIILALYYAFAYALVGVPFGFLIGLAGGLMSFIPYVGASTAFGGALLFVFLYGLPWSTAFCVLAIFLVAQAIEGYVLTPRLVGKNVGLNPLVTILAILAGANIGGLLGMIIAIPLTAFTKRMLGDLLAELRTSKVYSPLEKNL